MRTLTLFAVTLVSFLNSPSQFCRAADGEEERQLVQKLQSNASLEEKNTACARLKRIGTGYCIPALAALLLDEQLSHSARYALESMASPVASAALLTAVSQATGSTRVGIIDSLGVRADSNAVPTLVTLLTDPEVETAAAAAAALGQIGGTQAIEALQRLRSKPPGRLHHAAADGLLRCAYRLSSQGSTAEAAKLFAALYQHETSDAIRVGAYRGWILAAGDHGLSLMVEAIAGPATPGQVAALDLVNEIKVPGATLALAELLSKVSPPIQLGLVSGLGQRGNPAAVPALVALVRPAPGENQPAILDALGLLGDAGVIPVLTPFAATGSGEVQASARRALVDLRRGNVTETLLLQLTATSSAEQAELARALGARGDRSAVPKLLVLAQQGPNSARGPALQALGLLVDEAELPVLVDCVLKTPEEPARAAAAEALNSSYQRLLAKRGRVDVAPLAQGLATGSVAARIALLPVCSGLAAPRAREAMRRGLKDPDPKVRSAAIRALCDTIDMELLSDLMEVARQTPDENIRTLAVGGCVRLLTAEEAGRMPAAQRAVKLDALWAIAGRTDQKRLVLSGLAEVPDPAALAVVEHALTDTQVRNEAARAATKLALVMPATQSNHAATVLKAALAAATDSATRQAVSEALKQVQLTMSYLTQWQVTGPYRQEGKDYAALFDIVFPAETEGAPGVNWKALPAGTDQQRPFVLDLLKAVGGEQCVAYVRTWVNSAQDQPAVLHLGTDDGVKAWLDGKQVYALNVARPLQPGSDKVPLTLHAGWNRLVMKLTQNNLGWEFTAQILKPDGTAIEGLRSQAEPIPAPAH